MEDAIAFGAALEAAVLFLSLALSINLAVYGWLGSLGAWSANPWRMVKGVERLIQEERLRLRRLVSYRDLLDKRADNRNSLLEEHPDLLKYLV